MRNKQDILYQTDRGACFAQILLSGGKNVVRMKLSLAAAANVRCAGIGDIGSRISYWPPKMTINWLITNTIQ